MNYYNITKLEKNEYHFDGSDLCINVGDFNSKNSVKNDQQYEGTCSDDNLFWVSGGGSLLINDRYLPIVQRHSTSKFNPNLFSLFTGRADSVEEWINPNLLVRELFEELLIKEDSHYICPDSKDFNDVVSSVYDKFYKFNILSSNDVLYREISTYGISQKRIIINHNNNKIIIPVHYHINKFNDVNVIYIFKINLNLKCINFIDGEFYIYNNNLKNLSRKIFILDMHEDIILDQDLNSRFSVNDSLFTEHLFDVYKELKFNLTQI